MDGHGIASHFPIDSLFSLSTSLHHDHYDYNHSFTTSAIDSKG